MPCWVILCLSRCADLPQRLVQIPEQVFQILQADRETNQFRSHASSDLLSSWQLLVSRRCRMNNQAARIADISQVRKDLQPVNKLLPCFVAALQPERKNRTRSFGCVLLRQL